MIKGLLSIAAAVSLLAISQVGAQEIDSLKSQLNATTADSIMIEEYLQLSLEYRHKNIDSAQIYAQKSVDLSEKNSYTSGLIRAKEQMAWLESYRGNTEHAIELILQSKEEAEKLGDKQLISKILNSTGELYFTYNAVNEALGYFKQSLALQEFIKDDGTIINMLKRIGDLFALLQESDSAEWYFNQGLNLADKTGNLASKSQMHLALFQLDTLHHRYLSARSHLSVYVKVNDKLMAKENEEAIQKLEISYETEKKDDKIELLKRQKEIEKIKSERERNLKIGFFIGSILLLLLCILIYSRFIIKKRSLGIIEKQKEQIEEKNNENELLIRETHHRVKNNLQLILSLLGAQRHALDDDDKALQIIKESQNRIKSISLLHESLYDTDNFNTVRTSEYFKEIVFNIWSSFVDESKSIEVKTDIDDTVINTSLAVTLGLIINELVTNSLKYAFQNQNEGYLEIKFNKLPQGNRYNLEVSDNGCGFPSDFEVEKSESFGLQMVMGLVRQLNGTIDVSTENGTGFNIMIQYAEEL